MSFGFRDCKFTLWFIEVSGFGLRGFGFHTSLRRNASSLPAPSPPACFQVPGSGVWVSDFGFRVPGFGFWDSGSGNRASDCRIRVSIVPTPIRVSDSGFGFRVSGFGLRVSGFGSRGSFFRMWFAGFGFRVSHFGVRVSGTHAPRHGGGS